MATQITKIVKIHSRFRANPSQGHFNAPQGKEVPWLNVSGLWLAELGFCIGDKVNITMLDKKLIIEPSGENSSGGDIDR